jgi:hypothetical protein
MCFSTAGGRSTAVLASSPARVWDLDSGLAVAALPAATDLRRITAGELDGQTVIATVTGTWWDDTQPCLARVWDPRTWRMITKIAVDELVMGRGDVKAAAFVEYDGRPAPALAIGQPFISETPAPASRSVRRTATTAMSGC